MDVIVKTPDGVKTFVERTLVEETEERVYIEDETTGEKETVHNGTLLSVNGAETIGYVKNGEEKFFDAVSAEQVSEGRFEVDFGDNRSKNVNGNFDRAYTY